MKAIFFGCFECGRHQLVGCVPVNRNESNRESEVKCVDPLQQDHQLRVCGCPLSPASISFVESQTSCTR